MLFEYVSWKSEKKITFKILVFQMLLSLIKWKLLFFFSIVMKTQSTLVISTSVISNHRLSRRENLVLVLTPKSKIRLQNIVEKSRNCSWGAISPLSYNIFNIYLWLKKSHYIVICEIWLFKLFFPEYYKSDMSKYGYLEVF